MARRIFRGAQEQVFLLDRMIGCPILLTEDPVAKCKQGRRMAQRTHLSFLESG